MSRSGESEDGRASKRFLADFRVQASLGVDAKGKIVFYHPAHIYEVHLTEMPEPITPDEHLSVQIILSAETIADAEEATRERLEEFLHLLSFVTNCPYKITRRVSVVDWTPGVYMREAYAYGPKDNSDMVGRISRSILDTTALIQEWGTTPLTDTALRWYASGVRSKIPTDQFQFFWFVIELIATAIKSARKIADKCPRCSGDLFCPRCNEAPLHRPYEKQKIADLLKILRVDDLLISRLFYTRNALMHGTPREEIEQNICKRDDDFSFDKIVDLAGRIAWHSIFDQFDKKDSRVASMEFMQVNTFVNWTMIPKAHVVVGVPDPDDPKIENLNLPTISLVRPDRPPVQPSVSTD